MIMHLLSTLFGVANDAAAPAQLAPPPPTAIPSQAEMTSRLPAVAGRSGVVDPGRAGGRVPPGELSPIHGAAPGQAGAATTAVGDCGGVRGKHGSRLTMTRRFEQSTQRRLRRDRRKAAPTPPVAPGMPRSSNGHGTGCADTTCTRSSRPRRKGSARPGHKTPLGVCPGSGRNVARDQIDVIDLTAAFVDARYSDHEIDDTAGDRR